ncbi:MAG TPA: hypothetical protein VMF69_26800, partial [Gemmataceae bacterium]|nr:hypothetical protein [Gemmataceae bacterium]
SEVSPNGGSASIFAGGGGLNGPYGLAFNSQGDLFVGNAFGGSTSISEITPSGVVSTFASGGGLVQPGALAFDSQGDLFVANLGYINYLSEVKPNGTVITPFGSSPGFGNFFGLAFDSNGNLFATQPATGDIWEFSPNGTASLFANLPGVDGIVFIPEAPAPVPAPPSLTLFALGFFGIGVAWIRRVSKRLASTG